MSPTTAQKLVQRAESAKGEMQRWRRHIHQHPEMSFEEFKTTSFVASCLQSMNVQTRVHATEPGVVAEICGDSDGATIALRADMDALPIQEESDSSFASQVTGVSHACGHDFHTTILLGVAQLLHDMRAELKGRIRLLFQPAEEQPPGGARMLIERGAMESVDAILALHVQPELPVGRIGLREGLLTATIDDLDIEVHGSSGHSARPHHAVDPILAGASILRDLYSAMDRSLDRRDPVVLTFGSLNAGTTYNVIPDRAVLRGTLRCASAEQRTRALSRIRDVLAGADQTWHTQSELTVHEGYPSVINHPGVTQEVGGTALQLLGADSIHWIDRPSMGAEDFSRYLEYAPGCMFRLGVGRANGSSGLLHSSRFDPDEDALPIGAALMAGAALRCLQIV